MFHSVSWEMSFYSTQQSELSCQLAAWLGDLLRLWSREFLKCIWHNFPSIQWLKNNLKAMSTMLFLIQLANAGENTSCNCQAFCFTCNHFFFFLSKCPRQNRVLCQDDHKTTMTFLFVQQELYPLQFKLLFPQLNWKRIEITSSSKRTNFFLMTMSSDV